MELIDDHVAQAGELSGDLATAVHEGRLERLGRDQENARWVTSHARLGRVGDVAVPAMDRDSGAFAELLEAPELVVDERLQG